MTDTPTPAEPHRTPEIDEVFRRIGRNLLLFQHIEHLLKQLMTNARLEGTVHSMQANLDERRARIHKQTLGQLAGQFVDDVLADAGTIGGAYATSFGVDEQTTVQRLLRFIDAERGEMQAGAGPGRSRPFFAMYLPIAGHHPYSAPGPEDRPRPFSGRSERDLYLNDLAFGDQALAALRAALRQRGLDDQILWIVSGDHGEAFQQHPGNFAHTLYLYDENVRVPLILSGLWSGPGSGPGSRPFADPAAKAGAPRTAPQVASLIDVAPTLMALLGLPAPASWQGRSLLQPPAAGEPVARFLTDHGLLQLGLRHGPWKFIDEVETGRGRLFDLRSDPGEQHDLAAAQPERARAYREHLRAWADAQRARLQQARSLAD